jgi:hypothetical protein
MMGVVAIININHLNGPKLQSSEVNKLSDGKVSKPRISLVIATPAFAASYLREQILSQLTRTFSITLIVERRIDLRSLEKSGISSIFTFSSSEYDEIKYAFFHQVLAWRMRTKSSSFKLRIEREYPAFPILIAETIRDLFFVLSKAIDISILGKKNRNKSFSSLIASVFKITSLFIINIFKSPWRKSKIRLCASRLVHPTFVRLYKSRLKLNQDILTILKTVKSDLVVYPNIGFGALSIQVASACKQLSLPSLYLLDNWDNISSKSVMWEKPDYINVFGPQSLQHAVEIQKFDRNQIFSCGTPRYEGYLTIKKDKKDFDRKNGETDIPYILFTDTMHSYNINPFLKILSEEVCSFRKETGGKLKVIYRPYPRPDLELKLQKIKKYPYVEIDHDTLARIQTTKGIGWKYSLPDDTYLPTLVGNAMFLAGGLTSMLLEAAMLGKRYVGIAHNEMFSRDNPRKLFLKYTHLQDIEKLSHIAICRNKDEFRKSVHNLIGGGLIGLDEKLLVEQLKWFYSQSHPSYPIALEEILKKIVFAN